MNHYLRLARVLTFLVAVAAAPIASAQQKVEIHVHADQSAGRLAAVWAYIGHDEPNYTYSPEGRALLAQLAAIKPHGFHDRTHNLLTTGDGTPSVEVGLDECLHRGAWRKTHLRLGDYRPHF
ncbi:MAG TPA: hypothetical protein VMF66_16370 [Candidatus Acidoferrum sp.]|nr:hypothetical protein [Candidatus Acidoferrum sp.]